MRGDSGIKALRLRVFPKMVTSLDFIQHPELVFGIAGPIGVDMDEITGSLINSLKAVQYDSHVIKITKVMMSYNVDVKTPEDNDLYSEINYKMDYANALCKKYNGGNTLARIAVRDITTIRSKLQKGSEALPVRVAYIIRQLKRPDEVMLLRQIYGKQFILVSAYGPTDERKKQISVKLRRSLIPPDLIEDKVDGLIERDASEDEPNGQQLRETFHLADVFIDGINRISMDNSNNRFIQAFFGRTDISPSKDEYGMYAAKSASLRSADLSRQVGAAIFTKEGELITQGCNEVPKAFGGTYWDLEEPNFRDVNIGHDPNDLLKRELLFDLFDRLKKYNLLSATALAYGSPAHIVDAVTKKAKLDSKEEDGALVGASVMDLTEYGRVVHAEMCAMCDAARNGRSIKHAILYCTTFPCHNCTKHILACGIGRVVYMEPYPKSKAKDLHENEIEIEKETVGKVSFVPFIGISPFRYRDIFQKGKRKKTDGVSRRWYHTSDIETPMMEIVSPTYPELERLAISVLIGDIH